MKIVIIYGQSHKGSTYHIARMTAEKIGEDITEFFLPRDFHEHCIGCTNCIIHSETKCPHYQSLQAITLALDAADVIILASPVYVYHVTGAMKSFLDHYAYRWMIHRPEESMFKKQAICISTAAGAGMKSTNKDMADSTFFWGIPKTYCFGIAVHASTWNGVSKKKKKMIQKKTSAIAEDVKKNAGKITPGLKTKLFFLLVLFLQKRKWCKADVQYWKEKGWSVSNVPWKK